MQPRKAHQAVCSPPPSLLSGTGKLVATPAETEIHAFCGSFHIWTIDLSKYHQETNMTHGNSVVFFKKFILIVSSLGNLVHVTHCEEGKVCCYQLLESTLPPVPSSAFTTGFPGSPGMSTSVACSSPPWTYPASYPCSRLEFTNTHQQLLIQEALTDHTVCFTKHSLWVLLLFIIIASISQLLIMCQAAAPSAFSRLSHLIFTAIL